MDHPLDLASIDHVLTTTRSVRRRIDFERPIEPEVIERCIEVATQAPTGRGIEGWRFLVMTDPQVKAAMAGLYRRAFDRYTLLRAEAGDTMSPKPAYAALADRLHEMPALILVCMQGQPLADDNALRVAFYGSVLPAAWSLMVALRARGLGATWTSLHLLHEREAARELGIPEGVTQTVLLPVGYMQKAVLRPAARRDVREITYWNRWGAGR
jgi:nitroreductase